MQMWHIGRASRGIETKVSVEFLSLLGIYLPIHLFSYSIGRLNQQSLLSRLSVKTLVRRLGLCSH